jgi:hypothetical protein
VAKCDCTESSLGSAFAHESRSEGRRSFITGLMIQSTWETISFKLVKDGDDEG